MSPTGPKAVWATRALAGIIKLACAGWRLGLGGHFGGGVWGVGSAWGVGERGAPCTSVVSRTLANDIGFHTDGTSRAVQLIVQATSI
jgi:hypothetical protein